MTKEKKTEQSDNRLLAKMTFVTSLGDWLSYFALLKLALDLSGSVLVATLSLTMKSFAIALSAWLLPWLLARIGTRSLLIVSQISSAVILSFVGFACHNPSDFSVTHVYAASFFLTMFKQLFDAAREVHSRHLSTETATKIEHRERQAELLRGLFGAQFFGPLAAFLLLKIAPLWVPFALDGASFFVTGIGALTLKNSFFADKKFSLSGPFEIIPVLKAKKDLLLITLLRSVGFWIPNAFFNLLLFEVVTHHLSGGFESTAVLYSALGLGAALTSNALRNGWMLHPSFKTSKRSDGSLAFFAQIGYGVTCLALIGANHFYLLIGVVFCTGLSMGVNAVSTQAIRRQLTKQDELSKVISFEMLVGRLADAGSMILFGYLTKALSMTSSAALVFTAILFSVSATLHLKFQK